MGNVTIKDGAFYVGGHWYRPTPPPPGCSSWLDYFNALMEKEIPLYERIDNDSGEFVSGEA